MSSGTNEAAALDKATVHPRKNANGFTLRLAVPYVGPDGKERNPGDQITLKNDDAGRAEVDRLVRFGLAVKVVD